MNPNGTALATEVLSRVEPATDETTLGRQEPRTPAPMGDVGFPDPDLSESMTLSASMADTLGELIDSIAATERMLATVSAWRAELIEQARQWSVLAHDATSRPGRPARGWDAATVARRTVVTELACVLRVPERTAQNLVAESEALALELPGTMQALLSGKISYRHAQAIIEQSYTVPSEAMERFEEAVLPTAKNTTVAKLGAKARKVRDALNPESLAKRHSVALEDRHVRLQSDEDGMAWLTALLPAVDAMGIYSRLTDYAMSLKGVAANGARLTGAALNGAASGGAAPHVQEQRTLAHLRVDVFTSLLLDGCTTCDDNGGSCPSGAATDESAADKPRADQAPTDQLPTDQAPTAGRAGDRGARDVGRLDRGIRPRVLVTVPVLTLLGHSDEPAQLEGYGPIDPDTAKRLAGDAPSMTRILTHPETGTVLSVGREKYVVPNDLRTWLRVRDGTCRFPGCNRAASRSDIDHTVDWQFGGTTSHDNLAHLCPGHHHLKHHTHWQVRQLGGGTLEWTSPTKHTYITEPEVRMQGSP